MDEMELRERWQYYISSYMRVEPTEGVSRARLQKTVLARNLPSSEADSDDGEVPKPLLYNEGLMLRICLNSNKIVWEKDTSEFFIYATEPEDDRDKVAKEEHRHAVTEHREQRFREKMVMNNAWMRGMSQDEVQKVNENFQKWFKDGVSPSTNGRDSDENIEGVE